MQKTFLALGLALVASGFFGCNLVDKISTTPKVDESAGSAIVRVPALPQNYLAKSAPGAKALFVLTISGEEMATIQKSWTLIVGQSESLLVTGIPPGHLRLFLGQLVKISSTGEDTTVTHEGVDSVDIERNTISDVHLYLHKMGMGSAHVCVDVEGWAPDSSCITPPTPPPPSSGNAGGCWEVNQYNGHTGMLHLIQTGTELSGYMDWYTFSDAPVVGTILGDTLSFNLAYPDKAPLVGYYIATLDETGNQLINGFSKSNNGLSATWDGVKVACPLEE